MEFCKAIDCVRTISQTCKILHSKELRPYDELNSLPLNMIVLSATDLKAIPCRYARTLLTFLYDRHLRLSTSVTAALSTSQNCRHDPAHTLILHSPPEAGLLPHHQACAITRALIENIQRLKWGVGLERLTMESGIERLGPKTSSGGYTRTMIRGSA